MKKELATANAQLKADKNNTKPRADNNKPTSILDTVSKKLFHNISDEQHNSSQASHLNNAVETVTIKTNTRETQQITNINEAQVAKSKKYVIQQITDGIEVDLKLLFSPTAMFMLRIMIRTILNQ